MVGMMEPAQHLRVQLQGNSCRDELVLTGPFEDITDFTRRYMNTKILHACVETQTHTLSHLH